MPIRLRLDLADGRKVLVDYADMRCADDDHDARCDLPMELRRDLSKARRNHFDAVCITHLDDDHCKGFGEFFLACARELLSGRRARPDRRAVGSGPRRSLRKISKMTPGSSAQRLATA